MIHSCVKMKSILLEKQSDYHVIFWIKLRGDGFLVKWA